MSRSVRLEVLWAIRDSRTLNAQEKALLWAVESRGVHYGTWQTVAADAGMKRDAYYKWRRELQAKGALIVTERPGRTTLHEVNADWFAFEGVPAIRNEGSVNPALGLTPMRNGDDGKLVMEGNHEEDPVRGPLKVTGLQRLGPAYKREVGYQAPRIGTEYEFEGRGSFRKSLGSTTVTVHAPKVYEAVKDGVRTLTVKQTIRVSGADVNAFGAAVREQADRYVNLLTVGMGLLTGTAVEYKPSGSPRLDAGNHVFDVTMTYESKVAQ